jgi:hypothetical protein
MSRRCPSGRSTSRRAPSGHGRARGEPDPGNVCGHSTSRLRPRSARPIQPRLFPVRATPIGPARSPPARPALLPRPFCPLASRRPTSLASPLDSRSATSLATPLDSRPATPLASGWFWWPGVGLVALLPSLAFAPEPGRGWCFWWLWGWRALLRRIRLPGGLGGAFGWVFGGCVWLRFSSVLRGVPAFWGPGRRRVRGVVGHIGCVSFELPSVIGPG